MKRKLTVFLSIIMLISFTYICPTQAAFSAEDKYEVLCALGFFDKNVVYSGDASVTRIELLSALINSIPDEKLYKSEKNNAVFDDVLPNDAIADLAYNARMLGIMGDEKELKPYELLTIEDASFMILNLLGYGAAVQSSYAAYASSVGLTKAIPNAPHFTMNQLVVMLYNALNTDIMQWGSDNKSVHLSTVSGETYMTEILNAGCGRGLVAADRFTGLGGNKGTGYDSVVIDGADYFVGDTNANGYLGHIVDFYYRTNEDDDRTIVYLKTHDDKSVVEFDAENILEFENLTYTYATGESLEKSKRAIVLKSADIIYNGKLIQGDFNNYAPSDGRIKLIDNDGDNRYEVAVITAYEVVTVGNIDKENGIIRNLYHPDKEYKVDLYENTQKYKVCLADGTVKKFSDIFKYYTIFIAESLDKELSTIIMSDKKIKGSINSLSEEAISIDGKYYEPTDEFLTFNAVEIRSYGTFYLDPQGRIGSYEGLVDRSLKVGYLLRASKDDSGIEDDALLLKVFTQSGEVETFYTAKTLHYTNGMDFPPIRAKAENADVVLRALEDAKDASIGGGQLILYKQNAQGRVTEIEIAAKYTSDLKQADELNKRGNFRQITNKISQINHKNGLFLLNFRIGPETKVISVPSDISNEDKFEIYTGTTNCFAWNKQYTVMAFAKNSNSSYADYVLGFLSGTDSTLDENNVFVVESVSTALNDDDIPVNVIKGIWGSSTVEYKLDEESSEMDISSGDILRLGFDDMGNVTNISKVFDYKKQTTGATGSLTQKYYSYFGYAYNLKGSTLEVSTKKPDEVTLTTDIINTFADKMEATYKYDSKTKKITSVNYNDIKTYKSNPSGYSKVFAWFYYGDHKMMVIYD